MAGTVHTPPRKARASTSEIGCGCDSIEERRGGPTSLVLRDMFCVVTQGLSRAVLRSESAPPG